MSERSNNIVASLAMAGTLAVIPPSAALVKNFVEGRQAIAVLRTARTWAVRDAQVLAPDMYVAERVASSSEQALRLVVFLADWSQIEGVSRNFDAMETAPLGKRSRMSLMVVGVGQGPIEKNVPPSVAISRIKDPEEFSIRTGILVLPFSLILTTGGNVIAAGPGLPNASFIREAAQRFSQEGPNAATTFRPMTADIRLGLTPIQTFFPSADAPR